MKNPFRLWWIYVPWVRHRRLERFERALAVFVENFRRMTPEELVAAMERFERDRGRR